MGGNLETGICIRTYQCKTSSSGYDGGKNFHPFADPSFHYCSDIVQLCPATRTDGAWVIVDR